MVYNKADQLIRWPGMHTYAYDGTGNLTQVKNDSETQVVKSYAYDAYGSLLSHDRFDGSVNQPYQYVGQLGYYTHWMEPDFELLQLGVRFYDPEVGRFTQRDALAHSNKDSLYAYSDSSPIVYVDPSGQACTLVNSQLIPGIYARQYVRTSYGHRDRQVGSVLYPRGVNCFCVCVKQATKTDFYQVQHYYKNTYSCMAWTSCGWKRWKETRIESNYTEESETADVPSWSTGKTYWLNGTRVGDDCVCPGVKS